MHVHCTLHAVHPSLWVVIDAAEKTAQEQAVSELRASVISTLEHDCAVKTSTATQSVGDVAHSVRTRRGPLEQVTPAMAPPLPPLARPRAPVLTVAEVRARAISEARARQASVLVNGGFAGERDASARAVTGGDNHPETMANTGSIDDSAIFSASKRIRTEPINLWSVPAPSVNAVAVSHTGEAQEFTSPPSAGGKHAALASSALIPARAREAVDLPGAVTLAGQTANERNAVELRASVAALLSRAIHAGNARDSFRRSRDSAALERSANTLDSLASREAAATLDVSPAHIAAALESAISRAHGAATIEYRHRARGVAHILGDPRNSGLRAQLTAGDLAPSLLATMPLEDFASAEERAERLALAEPPRVDDGEWLPAGLRCDTCFSESETEYQNRAQQRDIRKAEVWGSGDAGTTSVLVRCKHCGAEWMRDAM